MSTEQNTSAGSCQTYGGANDTNAFPGKIAVGIDCEGAGSNLPTMYVQGTLEVIDTATLASLQFVSPSGANPTLAADGDSQLGLTGALRVSKTLGVGVKSNAVSKQAAQLVVQGAAKNARPLQAWQDSTGQVLGQVDAQGRLSVGASSSRASLTVQGAFLMKLYTGAISGQDHSATFTGKGTHFAQDLVKDDLIGVLIDGKMTSFVVASTPTSDTKLEVTEAASEDFDNSDLYVNAPLLALANSLGSPQLTVDRRGNLQLTGGLSAAGGPLAVDGGLTVKGDLTIQDGHLLGTAIVGTDQLADGVVTTAKLAGGAVTADKLSLANSTLTGPLTISGGLTSSQTLTVGGQTTLSGLVGINRDPMPNQHLIITPTQGNMPFNVTDPTNTVNWLSVMKDGSVSMNGGGLNIGQTLTVGGQTTLSGLVAINTHPFDGQHLIIIPTLGYIPFNVTDPTATVNWLSVMPDGQVVMNGSRGLAMSGDLTLSGGSLQGSGIVGSEQLQDNAVTSAKLAAGAVIPDHLNLVGSSLTGPLTISGDLTLNGNLQGNGLTSSQITIGSWTIQEDSNGNLTFTRSDNRGAILCNGQ
jgi:hypothetical protein